MAALASLLLAYRYILFVLFVICNAIICSVAVWNRSLTVTTGHNLQIDAYLIFLGAFGIMFIIPIVGVDLFRKNALTSRVWFECLWVGIFWVMELAGASAVTASLSNMVCVPVPSIIRDACNSTTVLLTFTWILSVLLMIYVLALALFAVMNQEAGQNVWQSTVRTFPWFATRESLASTPPSPVRQFQQKPLRLAAPHPQRPIRHATLDRDLEAGEKPAARRGELSYEPTRPAPVPPSGQSHSLYPAVLKSNLPSHVHVPQLSGATPPPLGDWPRSSRRPDVKQNPAPASSDSRTSRSQTSDAAARPRPSHPRKGSNGSPSRQRPIPPPLDLTRISAYRTIDEQLSRRQGSQ